MSTREPDHWIQLARTWDLRSTPLRPAPEDIQILQEAVRQWHGAGRREPLRALLLGVTPEIARMPWPPGTRLLAVDQSRAMIGIVWPGAALGFSAVCARWPAFPVGQGTHDLVLGDGSFTTLRGDQYATMAREIRRMLRAGGLAAVRFFTRPDTAEPVARVLDDLLAGRIGNFHVFKWRLSMALHGSLDEGARLSTIWDVWHAAVPHPEELARRLGWPLPEILTMDDFRGVPARYTFPTLAEARAAFGAGFEEAGCHFPAYELGERCPTLVLRPR